MRSSWSLSTKTEILRWDSEWSKFYLRSTQPWSLNFKSSLTQLMTNSTPKTETLLTRVETISQWTWAQSNTNPVFQMSIMLKWIRINLRLLVLTQITQERIFLNSWRQEKREDLRLKEKPSKRILISWSRTVIFLMKKRWSRLKIQEWLIPNFWVH